MRVLHGTFEIAGQMGLLTRALKRRGHVAAAFNTFHSYLGYKEHLINTDKQKIGDYLLTVENGFDIFHFHYCNTFMPDFSDLRRLKEKGKTIVMHHWGDDVRQLRLARQSNPYVNTQGSFPDDYIEQRLGQIAPYVDAAIVQDAEVLRYVTPYYARSYVLPIAIDAQQFPFSPPNPTLGRKPVIVHAPTNPGFKGTAQIEAALERLRGEFDFEYVRVTGMSNEEATQIYRRADLVIDQVLCGSYGLLSCEAMALGKPVVCYIRDDLRSAFPGDLPIVSANPDSLAPTLRGLLGNPGMLRDIGTRGRTYVQRVHDLPVVCDQLLHIYAAIT